MDQRDSCISSPALNELSKRLSDETDRLKYARVIYLSQSVGQRIDAIRKELQAPREYNKRQMRELVLDRNKCIHHSLIVTTSIGATKKRQHDKEASRRSTSYMPQLAHSINAFEHNTRCRCSSYIPPRCLGKRSTSIIDEVPPEQDVDESCDDTTESSRCSDEFIAEIQQRYSSYANIVHTTSFKYDLSGCPKEDKETGSGNMYENKEEMMEYQEEDAITISAVPTTPNQQAQEYNDFYAMVESLSNSGDPPSLASTLLSSYACKSLQDTKADDCTTLHEDQDCYLDIAEKHQHGDVEFSNNNDMPPTPPLSPAVAQGLCEPVKITPASKPSISIEHVHKKSRSGLRGIFKRTQYQVNDVLVSGRSLAGPLLDCLYSAKDLTANEPRVVLKLALTEVGSDTPNIMRRHGFNFEILHPGAKSKVGSPRLMASVKDTALAEAIQDWMELVCRSYPQAARLSKAQRVLRDNKKIYVVFDKF